MTTAHRPTFDPAKGKSTQSSASITHARALPAYTKIKYRQRGQGGIGGLRVDQLREKEYDEYSGKNLDARERFKNDLLDRERATSKRSSNSLKYISDSEQDKESQSNLITQESEEEKNEADDLISRSKLAILNPEDADSDDDVDNNNNESSSDESSDSSDNDEAESGDEDNSDDSDDEDEEALLRLELEKIERERAERQAEEQQARRLEEISHGNPLLNKNKDSGFKRRWNDDVVFQNQARGVPVRPEEANANREFINDSLRSDFHRRFMKKYIR